MDRLEDDPALAFALYASSAATAAVVQLKAANLMDQSTIDRLIANLTLCRQIAGQKNPILIEHAELLTDMLTGSP